MRRSGDVAVVRRVSFGAIARDTGTTLFASGAVLLMVAATNVLIGRLLGVEGQGRVAAATLLPMIVAYGGELGIPVAAGYLMNVDLDHRNETIATARYVCACLALILTAIAAALIALLPLPPSSKPLSLVFCLFVGLSLFHRLHLTVLQAEMRMSAFNGIRVFGAATYLFMLLFYAFTGTATVFLVILALLLANLAWFSSSAWCAASRPLWMRDRARVRALFRYGLRAHLGNVSSVDGLKLDQLVLAIFLSTGQLGLYVAAMTIIIGNRVIGTSIGMVCFPLACRGAGAGSASAQRQLRRLLLLTAALAVPIAMIEIVFGSQLLTLLFGQQFAAAGPALRVLAVGSVFMNLRQPCADWLRGCGKPGVVAISEGLGAAALLILSAALWNGTILRVAWIVSISAVVSLAPLPKKVLDTFRSEPEAPDPVQ